MNVPVSFASRLKQEVSSSVLLQYAIPLVVAILVFYAVDVLWQANTEYRKEFDQLLKREARILSLQNQADWQAMELQAQSEAERLTAALWEAESIELAAADLQTTLRRLTNGRIEALRIQMAEPLWVPSATSWQLSAEVSGRLLADEVLAFMASTAEQRPLLTIDRLSYSPSRNGLVVVHFSALVNAPEKHANGQGSRNPDSEA